MSPVLTVEVPPNFLPERDYILSLILSDFLNVQYERKVADRRDIRLTCGDEAELLISDQFFSQESSAWLTPDTLPNQPLKTWNFDTTGLSAVLISKCLPVIFGDNPDELQLFSHAEGTTRLGLDVFGSAFFMLSRYEEAIKADRDLHDRFPATASLAWQEGFLDRPIINEYVEILWACIKRLWPTLQRRRHKFTICPTHDMDIPFAHAGKNVARATKRFFGDLLLRHNPSRAVQRLHEWRRVKLEGIHADPFNTVDRIMDISERENLHSSFNFFAHHGTIKIDGDYRINDRLIRHLLWQIHQRGHNIGFHASYSTYLDVKLTVSEFKRLRQVCAEMGIEQEIWGGRQHYLRWRAPQTWSNWESAGLSYDSTLSFADVSGFRCGVCYDYPVYDVVRRRTLQVKERPLIVMESTVIDDKYMGFGTGARTLELMTEYKRRCRMFDGIFTLLWHNDRLADEDERSLYEEVLRA